MGLELLIATVMVLVTVSVHGAGLLVLARLLAHRERRRREQRINPLSLEGAFTASALALGLMALHAVEIWLYAGVFLIVGAIPELRDAVYFSTISYATIGYTDTAVDPDWRLFGAIEGVNGTLLMGWSVAFFVTVMTRFLPTPHTRRHDPT
jgi:Ion channel